MKKLKEYIERKKLDKKFKQLGQAQLLSETNNGRITSASSVSQKTACAEARARAAEAVEKRLNQNKSDITHPKKAVYLKAKRELEIEIRRLEEQNRNNKSPTLTRSLSFKNDLSKNESVCFTCDLLDGVVLPKSQIYKELEKFLVDQLKEEPIDASILMIRSLNSSSKAETAISTIQKYLENIIYDPDEFKFRRIRMTNKVFKEKVFDIKGTVEFLSAIGFVQDESQNETTGEVESFLVMFDPIVEALSSSLQDLLNSSAVGIKLYRDVKVYSIDPSKPIPRPEIPSDFFCLNKFDIKNMQDMRIDETKNLTTLQLSKKAKSKSNYKYAMIRVRFPDNYILQATFSVYETVFAVRELINNHLDHKLGVFFLSLPGGTHCVLKDEKNLLESGLAPAALIHFDWSEATMKYFTSNNCNPLYLNTDLKKTAKQLE